MGVGGMSSGCEFATSNPGVNRVVRGSDDEMFTSNGWQAARRELGVIPESAGNMVSQLVHTYRIERRSLVKVIELEV
jgi:hypothetical protein